ncbi:MAG: GHKL domain-containing protein [Alphaproteobacteria bacterium]|nr:GHKL domain-containing protein [Alphaproteobacteria bacterium]
MNLIRNAIEAMSETNPLDRRIAIRTAAIGTEVAIAVRDYGPGFKPEQREQMFDAFFSTKRGNMGMGLSIGRTIAEAHGGTLRAYNNDDGGATFELKLTGDGGVFGRAR